MLAKKFRLPIQDVLGKRGATIKALNFLIKIFPNNLGYNRFGVIISKKVAKQSTKRNKIKRIFFNSLKTFLFSGKMKSDYLIIVSPKITELKKEDIKKLLNKFLAETTKFI